MGPGSSNYQGEKYYKRWGLRNQEDPHNILARIKRFIERSLSVCNRLVKPGEDKTDSPVFRINFLNVNRNVFVYIKIFTLGAGFGDVLYELAALVVLTMLYFGVGVWLFQRAQMR